MHIQRSAREPAEVRRERVMELAQARGFVRPGDIAQRFEVSDETGRRDIAALSQAGRLTRVHGGAVTPERAVSTEPERQHRAESSVQSKEEIARAAVACVGVEDTVFFDVGTTIEAAARALPAEFRGTAVTTSLMVAYALGNRPGIEVHVAGGRMRLGEYTTFGPDALQYLSSFRASVALLGCGAVDTGSGISDYVPEDVPLKRAMIAHSARAFVLATSGKLGRSATRSICPLSGVSGIVTDAGADALSVSELEDAGATVLVARQ